MPGITSNGRRGQGSDTTLELAELLSHSARRLRRGTTAQLAPLGLTMAQAQVLRIVASATHPLRMADIAARLGVVPRSVTTMVDGVEGAGLIVRATDPDDRRSVLVSLTATGHALLKSLERARRATAEDIFGALATDERADLARLLGTLCQRDGCGSCTPAPDETGHRHRTGAHVGAARAAPTGTHSRTHKGEI